MQCSQSVSSASGQKVRQKRSWIVLIEASTTKIYEKRGDIDTYSLLEEIDAARGNSFDRLSNLAQLLEDEYQLRHFDEATIGCETQAAENIKKFLSDSSTLKALTFADWNNAAPSASELPQALIASIFAA